MKFYVFIFLILFINISYCGVEDIVSYTDTPEKFSPDYDINQSRACSDSHLSNNSCSNPVGNGVYGNFAISGVAKWLAGFGSYGSIGAFYGYESLAFCEKIARYCYGGISSCANKSVIGVAWGGGASAFKTFGSCDTPSDYTGGFLSLSTSASNEKGVGGAIGLNIGFDMKSFNDYMAGNDVKQEQINGMYNALKDILKLSKNEKVWNKETQQYENNKFHLTRTQRSFLKIFSTLLFNATHANVPILVGTADMAEFHNFPGNYSKLMSTINEKMRYYWDYGDNSSVMDVTKFTEAVEKSVGNCHSISAHFEVSKSFDFEALKDIKQPVQPCLSYSLYGKIPEEKYDISTASQAATDFKNHLTRKKAKECEDIEGRAAFEMGRYLKITGAASK